MKTVVITGPRAVACIEKTIPAVQENEQLIQVTEMGICGSDIERASRGEAKHIGIAIGHELVGIVQECGSGCTRIVPGQRVSIVPLIPCFHCDACQKGDYNLCEHYSFIGSRQDGGGAEYLVAPERNAIVIPENVTDDEAALLEPLTVAMHAVLKTAKMFGSRVLVIGGGVIGQLTWQVAKQAGCEYVALTDIVRSKLELAKKSGCDFVFNARDPECETQIKTYLQQGTHSVIFETSGSSIGKQNAIMYSKPRGEILYVGGLIDNFVLSPDQYSKILRKELCIKGCWMNYSGPFPGEEWVHGLSLLNEKRIVTGGLVSHRFSFSDASQAFDLIFNKKEDFVKIMLHP